MPKRKRPAPRRQAGSPKKSVRYRRVPARTSNKKLTTLRAAIEKRTAKNAIRQIGAKRVSLRKDKAVHRTFKANLRPDKLLAFGKKYKGRKGRGPTIAIQATVKDAKGFKKRVGTFRVFAGDDKATLTMLDAFYKLMARYEVKQAKRIDVQLRLGMSRASDRARTAARRKRKGKGGKRKRS